MSHEIVQIIDRTYADGYLPARLDSLESRVGLVGISGQEADLIWRDQKDGPGRDILGPALGLWQFERGGGVRGVMNHPASSALARKACALAGVQFVPDAVWRALKVNDRLACAFARLLLLTDPRRLPSIGQVWELWDYYKRNWRPGKPHPELWAGNYARALRILKGAAA